MAVMMTEALVLAVAAKRNIVALPDLNPGHEQDAVEHAGGRGRHLGILVNEVYQGRPGYCPRCRALNRVGVGAFLDGAVAVSPAMAVPSTETTPTASLKPW